MQCPKCGLEMILYETGEQGDVYVCRNPQCEEFEQRLEKPQEEQ